MTVNHGEDFSNLLEFIKSETRYQLYRTKLNASDFGIPQERERIFIVGLRPDISCESFSSPTSATGPLYDQLPDKMPSKYALESVEGLPNQVIRVHQYPNGHKSQLSPSLMQSYGENFNYESFTELQAHYNIQIRPAALIWKILYKLWESGEQPTLSLDPCAHSHRRTGDGGKADVVGADRPPPAAHLYGCVKQRPFAKFRCPHTGKAAAQNTLLRLPNKRSGQRLRMGKAHH